MPVYRRALEDGMIKVLRGRPVRPTMAARITASRDHYNWGQDHGGE